MQYCSGMGTYFISDLHLQTPHSQGMRIFLNFLDNEATNADAVYILGDLFECWVGDDDHHGFDLLLLQQDGG